MANVPPRTTAFLRGRLAAIAALLPIGPGDELSRVVSQIDRIESIWTALRR
ncbi:MAG: hypothetical protein K1X67_09590 [Fimbriimonadaceae bacterium]|nr:hypothetical protein [Fimbriimonadaceae bacterium]